MTQTTTEANPGGNPPPVTPPWYGTPPADILGHLQNKGWHAMEPAAAALAAATSHRELELLRGVPQEQILRLPKDASDEAGWQQVYRRLGAPDKPEGYTFEGVDFGDEALTKSFTDAMRGTAAKFNVPKDMAAEIAKSAFKFIEDRGKAEDTEAAAKLQTEQKTLDDNWGVNKETNLFVAKKAAAALAAKLGPDGPAKVQAALDALDGQIGHAAVMEMMRAVGTAMGEDKFVSGGSGNPGAMSREQAIARRFELTGIDGEGRMIGKGDKEWMAKLFKGDAAAKRENASLTHLITGIS